MRRSLIFMGRPFMLQGDGDQVAGLGLPRGVEVKAVELDIGG